jgi:hypothetical protein
MIVVALTLTIYKRKLLERCNEMTWEQRESISPEYNFAFIDLSG